MKNQVKQILGVCYRNTVSIEQIERLDLARIVVVLFVLLCPVQLFGQEEDSLKSKFNIDLHLKNMHLWHGSVVTPGAMFATSIEYQSNNQKFVAGLWGGSSFNGDYKEFTYYTRYSFTDQFYAQLTSHNNYSGIENPNIFSYDKYTSPNFLSLGLGYTVSESLPLNIYYNTILFGNGGDFEINEDGTDTNSYSMYLELSYPVYKRRNTEVNVFVGGAFSFFTESTFYSESANIVNVGLSVDQSFTVAKKKIPIKATAFWNPETKVGAIQFDIKLF